MLSRSAVMTAAWARYRVVAAPCGYERFDRRLFGRILRMAWINAKAEAERARRVAIIIVLPTEPAAPTALDVALEALRYLPAHVSYERAAAAVRNRFSFCA